MEPAAGGPGVAGHGLLAHSSDLTLRQPAPLFGISKSTASRVINHLGLLLALQPRKRFAKNTVLIADGTQVPTSQESGRRTGGLPADGRTGSALQAVGCALLSLNEGQPAGLPPTHGLSRPRKKQSPRSLRTLEFY